jgi:predicted nucleotidyltransferase
MITFNCVFELQFLREYFLNSGFHDSVYLDIDQVLTKQTDDLMVTTTTPDEILQEIIDRIVLGLHPEKIYLFGSRSGEEADPESDFDLMVVLSNSDLPRYKRESQTYDLLWGLKTPVDVVVLTLEEFQNASKVKTSLVSTVKTQGKLIYGQH